MSTIGVENPWILSGLLLIPLTVWWSRRSLAGLGPTRKWTAIAIRSACLALLVLALAGFAFVRKNKTLSVIFLLDQSNSIPSEEKRQARRYVEQAFDTRAEDDRVGVVFFDGVSTIDWLPALYDKLELRPTVESPDRTDLAQAVRTAVALFPQETTKRLVIISDFNETSGSVATELARAKENGVAVDYLPVHYQHDREVVFERLVAPSHARRGQTVDLKMKLSSKRPIKGRLRIYHNGKPVDLDPDGPELGKELVLPAGPSVQAIQVPLHEPGVHRFTAEFEPDQPEDDEVVQNNRAETFTMVESKGRVLCISNSDVDSAEIIAALKKENIEVEPFTPGEQQIGPLLLAGYDAVILANAAADSFTQDEQKTLASYVEDTGGGLVMVGGENGFGAGGWLGSPVEEVLPVKLDIKQKRKMPRGALVLIMHSCEMPQGNYWGEQVAIAAVKAVSSLDYVGIISYDYTQRPPTAWQVKPQLAGDKRAIIAKIKKMVVGDMPDFDTAMTLAYRALKALAGAAAQKHIIIITDADPSIGPGMPQLIANMKAIGITMAGVAVFPHMGGLGRGASAMLNNIIKPLTPAGKRPAFYTINRPGDQKKLPQIFIKEAKMVTRSLIREARFRPRLVMPHDTTAGLRGIELPRLYGHVLTSRKQLADVPMISDKKDPILAMWQRGLGKAVAFTSDATRRWAQEWVGWDKFASFWGQIVRWSMRQATPANFEIMTRVEGDEARVVIEAVDKDAGFLNFLDFQANVSGPGRTRKDLNITQVGPGRYEGRFPVMSPGTYMVTMAYGRSGAAGKEGILRTGVTIPYSPEYRQLATNERLVSELREATQGRVLGWQPQADGVFKRNLPPVVSRMPQWDRLLKLFLFLFLLDVAVRRVAVDWRAAARRVRQSYRNFVDAVRPAEASTATMERLKTRRQQVQEEYAADEAEPPIPPEVAEAPDRKAKFDKADRVSKERLAKVRHRLDQERAGTPSPPAGAAGPTQQKTDEQKRETEQQSLSRLLAAKKRAREEMDEGKGKSEDGKAGS